MVPRSGPAVALIAPFPPRGALHTDTGGVAAYAKNLTAALHAVCEQVKPIVFANREGGPQSPARAQATETPAEACRVVRCWQQGTVLYPLQILAAIWPHRGNIGIVHVQHEYSQFGGALTALAFPVLLAMLRLLRVPLVVTLHGVVGTREVTASFCRQHFLRRGRSWYRQGLRVVHRMIARLSDQLIVHHEQLRSVLIHDYGVRADRVAVVSHGIEERGNLPPRERARATLGINAPRVLLFLGYLARYKAPDVLLEALQLLPEGQYALVLAGGAPVRLRGDADYVRYTAGLRERARTISGEILFPGFVPEEEMALYFAASDLAVFPYYEMHASSGPLSLALSHRMPFLASRAVAEFYGVPRELSFDCDGSSLARAIERFFSCDDRRAMAVDWTEAFVESHLWRSAGELTCAIYQKLLSQGGIENGISLHLPQWRRRR